MEKKQEKLNKLLELSQLINKTVFFESHLYKIFKVNSVYIYGYNYEIDVIIDIEKHDFYKHFPPFCVSRNVKYEELSELQTDILKNLQKKSSK